MKFIRKEYIVTTIFNQEVADKEVIRTILTNLKMENISFSAIIRKGGSFNLAFEKAIIVDVRENEVDLISFKKNIKTVMNNVPFSDIVEIDAKTMKNSILDSYEELDRWDILDI